MRSLKLFTTAVAIGSLLALGACKKGEKKSGDQAATDKDNDKGADKKSGDDPSAAKAAGDRTKETGDPAMAEKKELAGKFIAMFESVADSVTENEGDCAKMAASIQKIATDNKALITAAKELDGDPAMKKWTEETHGPKIKATMAKMMVSMMKNCEKDEGVAKAFGALSD